MIRVMVVDDESLAVEELVRLIRRHPDFEVVETAASGTEALKKLKQENIDVVFLDIEMPGLTGLEIASRLVDWPKPPCVVFATAYNQYAVEAFDANAVDYLLKPYEPGRLEKTLERIRGYRQTQVSQHDRLKAMEESLIQTGLLKRIVGHRPNSKDRMVINPQDVYYFYAENASVFAYLGKERFEVRATLKELMESLDASRFIQIHKAYVVNLDKIKKVAPMFSGNFEISLNHPDLPNIPLSRRYAAVLKAGLGGNW